MSTKTNPEIVTNESDKIAKVWGVNPDFKIKGMTLEQYQAQRDRLTRVMGVIKENEDALTSLRNERDDLSIQLNENTTRARAGIKGYFGADSNEYELAGGTRASERKKASPKAKALAAK